MLLQIDAAVARGVAESIRVVRASGGSTPSSGGGDVREAERRLGRQIEECVGQVSSPPLSWCRVCEYVFDSSFAR